MDRTNVKISLKNVKARIQMFKFNFSRHPEYKIVSDNCQIILRLLPLMYLVVIQISYSDHA